MAFCCGSSNNWIQSIACSMPRISFKFATRNSDYIQIIYAIKISSYLPVGRGVIAAHTEWQTVLDKEPLLTSKTFTAVCSVSVKGLHVAVISFLPTNRKLGAGGFYISSCSQEVWEGRPIFSRDYQSSKIRLY